MFEVHFVKQMKMKTRSTFHYYWKNIELVEGFDFPYLF